jgi:hypothetical protein
MTEADLAGLSFCESVSATSRSRWHLRRLTTVGPWTGGGIDTPSLCGRVKVGLGWDLEVPVTLMRVAEECPDCRAKLAEGSEVGE